MAHLDYDNVKQVRALRAYRARQLIFKIIHYLLGRLLINRIFSAALLVKSQIVKIGQRRRFGASTTPSMASKIESAPSLPGADIIELPAKRQRHRTEPLRSRFNLGTRTWAFFTLIGLYILPGLIGHEPWKQDETYIMEIVRNMLDTGDLTVPKMAGETFMEKPPLFYWVAAVLARLSRSVLAPHDGARLATGCFVFLTCTAVARCGRGWCGDQFGRTAVFVLLACFGMEIYAHLMLTDIALLAGIAIGMAGLPRWRTRPVISGLEIGTGIGVGFLAKGLLAPGIFGLSALLLPLFFSRWRERAYARTVVFALLAALPWLIVWPVALWHRSPALFNDWFWMNNIGRFVGFAVPVLGAAHDDGFWTRYLWWMTFPAAPLAAISLWRERATLRTDERAQSAIVLAAVTLSVLLASASARGGYALPLLPPLALLGARSALTLSPRLEFMWNVCARVVFGAFALAIWLLWAYVVFSHDPLHMRGLYNHLPPHPNRHVDVVMLVCCVFATLGAAYLMFGAPVRQAALQTWVVGMALCWVLLASLFMPWVDEVKSYRQVFRSLQQAIGPREGCIASYGLGESERAMLRYYDGIVTERLESQKVSACPMILLERTRDRLPRCSDNSPWEPVWQGARPADRYEHFWLFTRQPGPAACTDDPAAGEVSR